MLWMFLGVLGTLKIIYKYWNWHIFQYLCFIVSGQRSLLMTSIMSSREITTHAWPVCLSWAVRGHPSWPLLYHEWSGVTTHDLDFIMSSQGSPLMTATLSWVVWGLLSMTFTLSWTLTWSLHLAQRMCLGGHPWPFVSWTVRMTPLGPWKGQGSVFIISRVLMLLWSCCKCVFFK